MHASGVGLSYSHTGFPSAYPPDWSEAKRKIVRFGRGEGKSMEEESGWSEPHMRGWAEPSKLVSEAGSLEAHALTALLPEANSSVVGRGAESARDLILDNMHRKLTLELREDYFKVPAAPTNKWPIIFVTMQKIACLSNTSFGVFEKKIELCTLM